MKSLISEPLHTAAPAVINHHQAKKAWAVRQQRLSSFPKLYKT